MKEYELPENLDDIQKKAAGEWKRLVDAATESKHKERLIQMCYKKEGEFQVPKTKTETIAQKLDKDQYKRSLQTEFLYMTKNETKTVMIARYGMLDCGKNYKGTASSNCSTCKVYNNENHRLNSCKKWNFNNPLDTDFSVDFNNI